MEKYKQLSLFEDIPQMRINKHIRLIELFGGIGAQAKALENIGADFEHYKLVEFDQAAVKSYNAVHKTSFVASDITQTKGTDLQIVDTDKYDYIMTYSFPCQDLSIAGKQRGMKEESNTRSGLLWEVERILNECNELPQTLVMENVTQVHGAKNIKEFEKWVNVLGSLGYNNYYEDLNAKDYSVAQNRNRCFMVSTLYDEPYSFPHSVELTKCLRDYLEASVEDKYYLSDKSIEYVLDLNNKTNNTKWKKRVDSGFINKSIAYTLSCFGCTNIQRAGVSNYICEGLNNNTSVKDLKLQIGSINLGNNESINRVYSPDFCCPALNTMQGGHRQPKIIDKPCCLNSKGGRGGVEGLQPSVQNRIYSTEGTSTAITASFRPSILTVGQVSTGNSQAGRVYSQNMICPTLCAGSHGYAMGNILTSSYRIRKLTPLECWRLMGFDDDAFHRAEQVNSNTQLYKQAGNSIVVPVLEAIFRNMNIKGVKTWEEINNVI